MVHSGGLGGRGHGDLPLHPRLTEQVRTGITHAHGAIVPLGRGCRRGSGLRARATVPLVRLVPAECVSWAVSPGYSRGHHPIALEDTLLPPRATVSAEGYLFPPTVWVGRAGTAPPTRLTGRCRSRRLARCRGHAKRASLRQLFPDSQDHRSSERFRSLNLRIRRVVWRRFCLDTSLTCVNAQSLLSIRFRIRKFTAESIAELANPAGPGEIGVG